ncbi:gamma-glutamyl hydrolase 2 [Striga asiatica]|uniref:Gamma-glutamyl hydrolase 2 n=1 Tax=Striga asiatica TaxID=4170 RepID=A0A5A7Q5K6_STRAF|nr:gamma-glutamyl hydrolase 2 [Striga asiatica]
MNGNSTSPVMSKVQIQLDSGQMWLNRFTFAPISGLAVPLNTPHPAVCGQFPISHNPTTGSTADVTATISPSAVKTLAHTFLTPNAKTSAKNPNKNPATKPTTAAFRALPGLPAPNSFPTLVDTPKLNDEGKTYTNDVVCISIPIDPTFELGSGKSPHSKIMISYHHHSRHTLTQLGTASLTSGFQFSKHSSAEITPPHVFTYIFDTNTYITNDASKFAFVHTPANATPLIPRLRDVTRK